MDFLRTRCTLLLRLVVTCALFSSTFSISAKAAADQWAEEFKTPFASQIINVLDAQPLDAPTATSASLRTIAGLNADDPIIIEGSDNQTYTATVVGTPVGHLVTWTPAISGDPTTLLNGTIRSAYSLDAPKQSAIDAAGRIYTTDSFNNRIVVFDSAGRVLWTLGQYGRVYSNAVLPVDEGWDDCSAEPQPCPNDPQQLLGRFYNPIGIDVSPDGSTLVVSDQWNDRIQVFTQSATGAIVADNGTIAGPRFTAYAVGGFGETTDVTAAPAGAMYGVAGVAFDPATGRIAVADNTNNRIQLFTPTTGAATLSSIDTAGVTHKYNAVAIGSLGSSLPPGAVTFQYPDDIEFDRSGTATSGRIIVADTNNDRVQVLDASGNFICAIGDGDLFQRPTGVATDSQGRIYVADLGHSQIQVFAPNGPAAYQQEDAFGAEQIAAPVPGELLFISPTGVALSGGRLIVTEQGGQRLQVLSHASMTVESVAVSNHALTVQDPPNDTTHVTVTIANTGGVDLTGVTLLLTPNYQGTVSGLAPVPALTRDGTAGDTAQFDFDFTVTGPAATGFTDPLHFLMSLSGSSGNVTVLTAPPQDFNTGATVTQPQQGALAFGVISVETPSPGRAAIGDHITITVPVQNIGGRELHDVVTTVTPISAAPPLPVSPATDVDTIPVLAVGASQDVLFTFTAQAIGTVRFVVSVTGKDSSDNVVTTGDLTVPALPGINVVNDAVAPTVFVTVSPEPNPESGDFLRWHNGSPGPCTAAGVCPPRPIVGGVPVITWPRVEAVAVDNPGGSGVARLHWTMIKTSNQPQTDQVGTCDQTGTDLLPSSCTPGPGQTLVWDRVLTSMQQTIVIGFWAEDAAGNGAVALQNQNNCSILTCVTLSIDVDAPTLSHGAPVFSADNSSVSIPFVTVDDTSHVASIASPNTVNLQSVSSGVLVLTAEGASATGSITVTDFAKNSVTYAVPIPAPGKPVIRLDRTPPEAFNRVDVTALGRRCTTTIGGQPVTYFCTNKVYGTDNLPGLTTSAFAPVSVVGTKWGGDNDGDDDADDSDGGNAELHTYSFTDAYVPPSGPTPIQNPNQVTLVEKVRQSGNEARVRVVSIQYRQGSVLKPAVVPDWAVKKYEWSTNADGSLKSLNQKFELGKGQNRIQVQASFDAKSGVTTIKHLGRDSTKEVASGLILLRMTTAQGQLAIDYDVNAPVAVPDLAPPVLKLPSSLVVEAASASGAPVNFTVSAFDVYDDAIVPVTCTSPFAATFPLGTTTVGCSAADLAGNVAQGSFTITVRDTTAPQLTLPATIGIVSASSVAVPFTVSAVDAVSGTLTPICSAASGTMFKVGTTNVSCAATDAAGNTARGSFAVVIKKK